jgi:sialate O-acetylesterase
MTIPANRRLVFFVQSCLGALSLFALPAAVRADVRLAAPFGDNAVLQRDRPVAVWGEADPGEKVAVLLGARTAATTAGADGRWLVRLDPLPASAEPAALVVTGKNQVVLQNILVGDVWLCAGQSNMEWNVARADNAAAELAAAGHPGIRFIKIDRAIAGAPAARATGAWRVCTPRDIGGCSAVAYFFARDIHRETGVPVGLVQSSWSGAMIESFLPGDTLASTEFAAVGKRWRRTLDAWPANKKKHDTDQAAWEEERAAAKKNQPFNKPAPRPPAGPGHRDQPSGIYNAMVHPLAPFGLRGFLWYQGEGNAPRFDEYHALFAALIRSWRDLFRQGDLPFYWVQLPNYKAGRGDARMRAFLREAQDQALLLPATGQAVTIDIGNPDDEHPTNKQEVGRRLALIALANLYGKPVAWQNPRLVSTRPDGATLRVTLAHADGLAAAAATAAADAAATGAAAPSFELAGADREFHPATVTINNDATLTLASPEVPAPVAARYAWFNAPAATLRNAAGLPLAPFRTDDWPALDVSRTGAATPQDKGSGRAQDYFMEKHAAFLARAKEGPVNLLFIGDSITDGWSKAPDIWETHFGRHQPANFGISGDSTQHVLWRIAHGELDHIAPKVVVLMLGTNNTASNTPPETADGVARVVRRIQEKLPQTRILLLAIFPRGPRRNTGYYDDGIRRMEVINEVNLDLSRLDDGKRVRFLNINDVFLGPDGKIPADVMPDQLHPGPKGYQLWADAMQPLLDEMMAE